MKFTRVLKQAFTRKIKQALVSLDTTSFVLLRFDIRRPRPFRNICIMRFVQYIRFTCCNWKPTIIKFKEV